MTEERTDSSLARLCKELEMLVSAALIFSLFQLPGVLDGWYQHAEVGLGGTTGLTVFLLYYGATLTTYGLIAAFSFHLLLRSLWVGVLGMQVAFPKGIDWDRIEVGSHAREFYRRRGISLEALGQRADRLASSIFALLFLFVVFMLLMSFWIALIYGIAMLIGWLVPGPYVNSTVSAIFLTLVAVVVGIYLFAGAIDGLERSKRWGERVPEWAFSVSDRLQGISYRMMLGPVVSPILFTLLTHVSKRRMNTTFAILFYALIAVFMVVFLSGRGVIGFDSYTYLPVKAEEDALRPRYYENLRDEHHREVPTIPSDIVSGAYLRLFVPYDANEDNARIDKLCPELEPAHSAGLYTKLKVEPPEAPRRRALLDCLGRVYEVTVDGKPVAADWLFATHHESGARGLMAYLPTADWKPGRHLLVVRHAPVPGSPELEEDADEYFIPFWR